MDDRASKCHAIDKDGMSQGDLSHAVFTFLTLLSSYAEPLLSSKV